LILASVCPSVAPQLGHGGGAGHDGFEQRSSVVTVGPCWRLSTIRPRRHLGHVRAMAGSLPLLWRAAWGGWTSKVGHALARRIQGATHAGTCLEFLEHDSRDQRTDSWVDPSWGAVAILQMDWAWR
jgi:hypothetical protein